MKFFKIQKLVSIIPYFSTLFVVFASMFSLKRFRAPARYWLSYYGICIAVVTCSGLAFLAFCETHLIAVHIFCILLCTAANFGLIYLQEKAYRKNQDNICESVSDKLNQKKKNQKILGAVGMFLVGIAVIVIFVFLIISQTSDTIEDINGADTSLAVLTQDDILENSKGWEARSVSEGLYGNHTNVTGKRDSENFDYDKCTFQCETISGIKTMQITNITSDTLRLHIESVLESGNMEIYILVDGAICEKIPVGQVYDTILEGIAGKNVAVRFAAESAKLSITAIRDYVGASHDYSENHAWD